MYSKVIKGAALIAACALLAACAPGASTPAEEAKKTLVTVIGSDPDTFNPAMSSAVQNRQLGCLIYQGLVRVDKDYVIQPQLASSWKVSPDGLTYTFKLQSGITWTDGEAFTADDVVYSLKEVVPLSPSFAAASRNIASVEAIDSETVQVNMSAPFGPFLMSLSCDLGGAGIVPAHLFEGTDIPTNPASTEAPVGTGPFMLGKWDSGAQVTMVKNPNYWREGMPYLDEIDFRVIPQANARILSLLAGEVDYIYHTWVDRNALDPVVADDRFQVVDAGTPGDFTMVTNVRSEPFNNVEVRRALFQAIDFDFLVAGPMNGWGDHVHSAINSGLGWAHNPEVELTDMYPYDPDAARQALADAGYPDGFTVRLTFDAGNPVVLALAEAVAAMWGDVGLDVKLNGSEAATALQQTFQDWDFDVAIWGFTTSGDPALGIARLYVTDSIKKANYTNASGYSNPKVDELFAEGARLTDTSERAVPYFKVQKILAAELPTWPLVEVPNVHAAVKELQGVWDGLMSYGEWWDGVRFE